MYSLALLVVLLFSIVIFSGPIVLILTLRPIQQITNGSILKVLRRIFMGVISFSGIFVSLYLFILSTPWSAKAFSLTSIILNLWALDREYGRFISSKFRRDGNGPAGQR